MSLENKLFILFKQDNKPFKHTALFNMSLENKLFILFKQDNKSFKQLLMSFEQVIYLV